MTNHNGNGRNGQWNGRGGLRANVVREITISCEGQDEVVLAKPPNLSQGGMFINTSRCFPEGTVLNVRFKLLLTGAHIEARSEVRYRQPGVGVGVQFIGLSDEARRLIEREIGRYEDTTRAAMPRRHGNRAATAVRPRRHV